MRICLWNSELGDRIRRKAWTIGKTTFACDWYQSIGFDLDIKTDNGQCYYIIPDKQAVFFLLKYGS